jgi:hypothetical protein
MTIRLQKSTASQIVILGHFVDSTDGNTEKTSLTINNTDIKIWKTGATSLANKNSGGATHISNGIYYATLDATDTNTSGPLVIFVHVTGALPVRLECDVMDTTVAYPFFDGTGDFSSTQKTSIGTATWSTPATRTLTAFTGQPRTDLAGSDAALNNISVANILAGTVEGTTTLKQAINIHTAALAGKLSGAGTGTLTFRDVGDTKARITATVDANNNRTAMTLDGA